MTQPAQLSADLARAFILAGNARVTLESAASGARFTFKVTAADDGRAHFVKVLTGQDNESDYEFLGTIFADGRFARGRKSRLSADAPSARAFEWAWPRLSAGRIPTGLNVWHEGRCGRCNRPLTVPASIASGFGPECSDKLGLAA